MSKIKSVPCGCAEEYLTRKVAERHIETTIIMCSKCGHRWLVGTPKDDMIKAKRSRFRDEDGEE